ncbi:MAG: ipoprotein LpqH, partial [Mycobacterium sp.]|nr:ipoprotein LpqH [Mycobacterium sp.]
MKRGFVIAVGGTAIVVAGLSGCGGNKSGGGSSSASASATQSVSASVPGGGGASVGTGKATVKVDGNDQ